MAPQKRGASFIARNRAPRVQIEYDVELHGSETTVKLPFVMGVLADLSGKPDEGNPLPPVSQRKPKEVDVDNFDSFLKDTGPRVDFSVDDKMSGEEDKRLKVEMTFESMDDFKPDAIAKKVPALNGILEARNQLRALLTAMDGRDGAEKLIEGLQNNEALLSALKAAKAEDDKDEDAEKA